VTRLISQPKYQIDRLRQSFYEGEYLVFQFFDKYLAEEWEINIQPHLNGLQPEFVLLNPDVGIAVFEVKDWNLDVIDYWLEKRPERSPELIGC